MKFLKQYSLLARLWPCLLVAVMLLATPPSGAQTFNFKPRDLSLSTTATQIKIHGFADTLTVRQDRWDEMRQNWTTWGTKLKFKSIHDFVRFYVDYGYPKKVSDPYTLRLAYKVLGFSNMADTTAFTTTYDTLTISYKADSLATFQDMQYKKYSGYNKMMVIMTGLYKITGAGAAPQLVDMSSGSSFSQLNFGVEAAISVQPFHKMVDPGTGFVSVYGEGSTPVNMLATAVNDNLQLNWNLPGGPIPGDLEITPAKYELEWTYIDNYKSTADGTLSTIAASNLTYNFKNNATRVWVDNNFYQIPLIYQQGYLIYRVRIVRPDSSNFEYPVYGPWNVADNGNVGSLAAQYKYQILNAHLNDSLNWQYTVSFAEQGKYKQVMSYYDGMLKNRQSITRFNSMPSKLIATEQIYDFEGRPSISILPTPINNTYGFRYQFNVSTNFATNKPYRAGDFDTLSLSICPLETPPSKLAIGASASQYYSPSNPDQAGYQQFVPDAKGYPFVQTLFSPGYTDRVDKQGGAGDSLQIGFGHNVKNNYVSADQMDLNRLFGLDIGWAGFYRKTVSKDPNGQYSLNVTDYHGKTVASSMIGIPDTTTHAIVMNTNVPDTTMYTEDYIAGTAQNIIGNKRILDKSIFNDVAGNNIAQYIYAYAPYQTFCQGKYLTVKAKYNYALTDECGTLVTGDTGTLGTTGVTTNSATVTANGTVHSFYAQQGQEDLHKELTVNLTDVYAAVDSFMALDHTQNCLRTEPDFIKQEVLARQYPCPEDLEHMQCPSCGSKEYEMIQELWPNKDSVYIKRKYGIYKKMGGVVIGNDNSIFTILCHHGTSSTNIIVDSGNIRNVIHADGSSTGFPNGEGGIYTIGTNGPNNANVFAVSGTDTMHCHYRYQDTCLVHLPLSVVKLGETYTHLQSLPVDTFIYIFNDSIATTLLPEHPEYCHLLDCVDDAFAAKLNSIPDANVADALGLLTVSGMINHDPLYPQLNLLPALFPNAYDTLSFSMGGHLNLDTIALVQAYCNCNDTIMLNECRTHMFAGDISADILANDFVKERYFTTARGVYLANRQRYLGNLNSATSLYGNCATCQAVRMHLVPMPVFTGVFVDPTGGNGSGGGSGVLATDTGSFLWQVGQVDTAGADSLNAFANMLQNATYPSTAYNNAQSTATSLYSADNIALCTGPIDNIINQLVNCTDSTHLVPVRTFLLNLCNAGQVLNGNYTPAQITAAINYAGISMGDLCNPYLVNYDNLNPNMADNPGTFSCNTDAFYTDANTILNGNSLLALQNIGTSYPLSLVATNQFSVAIFNALGSTSGSVAASHDATRHLWILNYANTAGTSHVQVFFKADGTGTCATPFAKSNVNEAVSVSMECINGEYPGFANGYIGKFAFTTKVNHVLSGVTTQCIMPSWNDKMEINVDQNNPIALAIPMTQMRSLYKDLWDTLRYYTVYGADHPYYRTMLRNFLNYKLKKSYSDDQYLTFIKSASLADSMRIDRYPFYFDKQFNDTIAGNAFYAYINSLDPDVHLTPLFRMRFNSIGIEEDGMDLNGIPINKLKKFRDAIVNYTAGAWGNNLSNFYAPSILGPSYMGTIFIPGIIPFYPDNSIFGGTSGHFTFSAPSGVVLWNGTSYEFYNFFTVTSPDPNNCTANNRDMNTLQQYLYNNANIVGSSFLIPGIETSVNNEYSLPDKQAYLHYTYQAQNRPPYKVLDTLQTSFLNANVGAFGGKTLSYGNPERPGAIENLYVLDPATATTGTNYSKATYILNSVTSYFHSLIGKNTIFFAGSNTRQIQGSNVLTAYRCADTAFWYRYFGAGDTLYNLYVRTPAYLDTSDLPNYILQGITPNPGDGSSFSVKLHFTNPAYPTLSLDLNAYTDFVVAKNEVLHDVLLAHATTEGTAVADTVNNCERQLVNAAIYDGKVKYAIYIDSIRSWLRSDFYAYTMTQGITEHLNVSYRNQRFNYTLYEYDRAGNLAKTVPPAGIAFVPNNSLALVDVQRASNPVGASLFPYYNKPSRYEYNSLNQVINQTTPDGGKTQFFYDAAGRVIFSQNGKQRPSGNMTYTLYDAQGRIMETGEAKIACPYFEPALYSDSWPCASYDAVNAVYTPYPSVVFNLKNITHQQVINYVRALQRDEVVYTNYDAPAVDLSLVSGLNAQENLRKRVATIKYFDFLQPTDVAAANYTYAMHFSYDIEGNVKTLVRDYPLWKSSNQQFKRIDYDYDVISGKVNLLSYNRSFADQFYQRYSYDADNRITKVETSSDGYIWKRDAEYQYYQHGPLARMSVGDLRVQGVDYAYTIQGWLKAVNGDLLDTTKDMGSDAVGNSIHARDAVALSLDYFKGDYKPIGTKAVTSLRMPGKSMYNGNIPRATTAIAPFPDLATTYSYDQLNRIMRADYAGMHRTDTALTNTANYYSSYGYDADGNLQKLVRNGNKAGSALGMDSLIYHYTNNNSVTDNKLQNVNDYQANNYTNDIKQNVALGINRYLYDATGNVIKDLVSGQDTIQWSHYNKVALTQSDTAGGNMTFGYDGAGNRYIKTISKENGDTTLLKSEYNVRDAQGNILAIYNDQSKYVMTQQQWVTYVTEHFTKPCGPVYYISNILTPAFAHNIYFRSAVLAEAKSNIAWAANQLNISPVSTYLLGENQSNILSYMVSGSLEKANFYTRLAAYGLANGKQILGNSMNALFAAQGPGAMGDFLYNLIARPLEPQTNILSLLCTQTAYFLPSLMDHLDLPYSGCDKVPEQLSNYINNDATTFMSTLVALGKVPISSAEYQNYMRTVFNNNTKFNYNGYGDSLIAFEILCTEAPDLFNAALNNMGYKVKEDCSEMLATIHSLTDNSTGNLIAFINSMDEVGSSTHGRDYDNFIRALFLSSTADEIDDMQKYVLSMLCNHSPGLIQDAMNGYGLNYDESSCASNALTIQNFFQKNGVGASDDFIGSLTNLITSSGDYQTQFADFVQAVAVDSPVLQYQDYTSINVDGVLNATFYPALTQYISQADLVALGGFFDSWPPSKGILFYGSDTLRFLSLLYDANPSAFLQNYVSAQSNDYHILNTGLTAIPNLTLPQFVNKISCCMVYISPCTYTVVDTILHNALVNALKYENLSLASHVLYGSSRLGTKDYIPNQIYSSWDYSGPSPIIDTVQLNGRRPWYSLEYNDGIRGLNNTPWLNTDVSSFYVQHQIGQKQYELSNHLGNVQATVSDYPVYIGKTGDSIKLRNPALTSAYDYYPFGMLMPDRYVTDTSDHCVTVTQTKWVTHDTTICHDVYDWEWINYEIIGLATAVKSGTTLTFTAPTLNDAIAVHINVQTNLSHTLALNLISADRLTTDSRLIVEQQVNGNWQELVSSTFNKGLTRLTFWPTSPIVRWRLSGPYLVVVGSSCVTQPIQSQQAMLVDICNTDGDKYRFGFNGKEKVNEWSGVGNYLDYTGRGLDSRIVRWIVPDPLQNKYPSFSTYNFALNTPIWAKDPDGKDVIFVNGYRAGHTGSAFDHSVTFQKKLKDTYWNSTNKGFTKEVERYFNDHTEHFVSGDHWAGSSAYGRIDEGKKVGEDMVNSGVIKVSKENHIMTIVMHSQGNAEGVGIAMGIIEASKKKNVDVTVNLVFLAVHQPQGISDKMTKDLKARGIQFTYANDNSRLVSPQGKISGVEDANASNKNNNSDGLDAHSAVIDKTEALKAIEKTDQEKKIFVGKPATQ